MQSVKEAVETLERCRTAISPITRDEIDAWYTLGSAIDHLHAELDEEGREEPECNCHLSGDQADASDCDLHGRNR